MAFLFCDADTVVFELIGFASVKRLHPTRSNHDQGLIKDCRVDPTTTEQGLIMNRADQ
jgi:hypothetical protein